MPHADITFHKLHLTGAPVGCSHIQWCTSLPFFNHMFSITPGVHRTNLCRNSIRTQRGRSSGWDSWALSWDSWVTGVSLGPQSTHWLLCTCQSGCDMNGLLGDLGDTSRGERGERSATTGLSPTSRWLPPSALEKLHIAAGYCNTTVQSAGTDRRVLKDLQWCSKSSQGNASLNKRN